MTMMRKRKSWIALLAIVLLFAACKGETPTAPPAGGDGGGGNIPPENVTITLSASSTTPNVNSTVVITANVTLNGQPVPNGTAVEFVSSNSNAEFTDTEDVRTIRTTTNGVATASITSSVAGTTRVTATVNNVTRFIDITFSTEPPCVPPDPDCTNFDPTITGVTPNIGRPSGGERIRITGTNFKPTVRVIFDLGNGQTREAFVESSTATEIIAITPSVNLGAGQQLAADIVVLTQAGTTSEERVVSADAFTFRNEQLTPVIYSLTPASGPIDGGTRVTILGEGFQPPVQVFFGSAEARVIKSEFSEIIVEAPPARLTNPNGSGPLTGHVDVAVVNMTANTRTSMDDAFRYISKMQITGASPLTGSALGGTDITIDGIGFDSKVQVFVAGIEAQVLRVSGSQLLVRTAPLPVACQGADGPIIVNNLDNGDSDTYGDAPNEGSFIYIGVVPVITSVQSTSPPITPGDILRIVVDDPGTGPLGTGTIRFVLNNRTFIPTPSTTTDPSAPVAFEFALPLTGFTFPTQTCTVGGFPGTQPIPIDLPLTFRNESTACTAVQTISIEPPDSTCVRLPPVAAQVSPAAGTCLSYGDVPQADPAFADRTVTFRNTAQAGATPLVVDAVSDPGGEFTVSGPTQHTINGQGQASFTIRFNPNAAGTRTGNITFNTNDPNNPTFTVCATGNGT
jgi:IPT/TIG domain/Abnormal spindle-like microcephaly-assoc'd, ASPM-SPD-2-Hydin